MVALIARAKAWRLVLALLSVMGCADNPYVIGALGDDDQVDASAGIDAGVDAGAPLDPCVQHPDALVCSGFELPALDDWPETFVIGDAEVSRSTARSRSGSASLHATSRAAESTAVVVAPFEPRTAGELHLRVWLRVPTDVATETMNLFFLGDDPNPTEDPPLPFTGLDLNLEQGALQVYSPQSFPDRITGSVQIPRDRWFCLRVQLEVGDAGAVRVFVDDGLALEAAPHDTLPDRGVRLLRAGVDWSSGQTSPFEVFMDDLVLSELPVPCSAP